MIRVLCKPLRLPHAANRRLRCLRQPHELLTLLRLRIQVWRRLVILQRVLVLRLPRPLPMLRRRLLRPPMMMMMVVRLRRRRRRLLRLVLLTPQQQLLPTLIISRPLILLLPLMMMPLILLLVAMPWTRLIHQLPLQLTLPVRKPLLLTHRQRLS